MVYGYEEVAKGGEIGDVQVVENEAGMIFEAGKASLLEPYIVGIVHIVYTNHLSQASPT